MYLYVFVRNFILPRRILSISAKLLKRIAPKLTQAEGRVLGVGAKIFVISGAIYEVIYWITTLF